MANKEYFQLLKPRVETGMIKSGDHFGQDYTCLYVPKRVNREALRSDIAAGAVQFKSVEELLEKQGDDLSVGGESQYILVEAVSREEGLLAISYFMGEYMKERPDSREELEELFDKSSEQEDSEEFYDEWDAEAAEEDFEGCPEGLEMFEDGRTIPIIQAEEMNWRPIDETGLFGKNSMFYGGNMPSQSKPPYWTKLYGSIIIECNSMFWFPGEYAFGGSESAYQCCKSFSDREKVFVLRVNEQLEQKEEEKRGMLAEVDDEDEDELPFGGFGGFEPDNTEYGIPRFLLEFTADHLIVKTNEKARNAYYKKLFYSWMAHFGYSVERQFPMKQIIERMMRVDARGLSATMEKMFAYIRHNNRNCTILKKEHFQLLGIIQAEKKDQAKQELNMDDLVGMEEIKEQFERIVRNAQYGKLRMEMGMKAAQYGNVHMFLGAPGTAKTTFAQILGRMLVEKRLLNGTRFKSVTGAQLKGKYVGHTAPKVHKLFSENDIIFIDEAYSLAASDGFGTDMFSQEALAQLAVELEKHAGDRLVIFAGYGGLDVKSKNNKMLDFLNANPGIKSRINNTVYFKSYTPDEMVDIVHGIAKRMDMTMEEGADEPIREYFAGRANEDNFGNGREARSFVENCQMNVGYRVMGLPEGKRTKKTLRMITLGDVKETIERMQQGNRVQCGKRQFGF